MPWQRRPCSPKKASRSGASIFTKKRGQALVEFALLAALLMTLAEGVTDLAQVIGANEQIEGAAREAARQVAYVGEQTIAPSSWCGDATPAVNQTLALACAKQELGSPLSASLFAGLPGASPPGFSAALCAMLSTPPTASSGLFPTTLNTGLLYTCPTLASASADNHAHFRVVILWSAALKSPLGSFLGTQHLHANADAGI